MNIQQKEPEMEKLLISDLHIILVEPSDTQRKIITTLLLKEHVKEIDPVSTLSEARSAVKAHGADLIVSAMYYEDGTALELLKFIKEDDAFKTIPFMLVSSENRLSKLEEFKQAGVAAILPKPFEPRELLARIQSLLRRTHSSAAIIDNVRFNGLDIDKNKQEVILDDKLLSLSTTEYDALILFIENSGETLDREYLVENLRGISWQSYDRSVDVLVSRLRSKLGETPTKTRFIKTIHGVGYKFIGEPKN